MALGILLEKGEATRACVRRNKESRKMEAKHLPLDAERNMSETQASEENRVMVTTQWGQCR